MPYFYDEKNHQLHLAIYENPHLRTFFNKLGSSTKSSARLTIEMAQEFPVPLPVMAAQSSQQKVFQTPDIEKLHAEQKKLMDAIAVTENKINTNKLLKGSATLHRISQLQKKIIDEKLAPTDELIIDDWSG